MTGDKFIKSTAERKKLHETYRGDGINCECGAIAQICYQYQIPMTAVYGISDLAGENFDQDGREGYEIAAKNADITVMTILSRIKL